MSTEIKYIPDAIEAGELNRAGYDAARMHAQWHIGDPAWAHEILFAYLNPEYAMKQLAQDGMPAAIEATK